MCYKSIVGYKEIGSVLEVLDHRPGVSGTEEYLIQRDGGGAPCWETKYQIETDGCGEVYGESGGLYGHHGTGNVYLLPTMTLITVLALTLIIDDAGGSRDRVKRFRANIHAEQRLEASPV